MPDNESAVNEIGKVLGIPNPRAKQILTDMSNAGQALAEEYGLKHLAELRDRYPTRTLLSPAPPWKRR